jgi:putative ATP-dependent endonuclease of the OLD family
MKIEKIIINNYRLLKDLTIDLEEDLSLVIGKNNCGKTSFLSLLEKFLISDSDNFSFDDFNLEYQQELKDDIIKETVPDSYNFKLQLRIYIHYNENDASLRNISSLMLNLNPSDNVVVIAFEYSAQYQDFLRLKEDFRIFEEDNKGKDILFFLKKNHKKYFQIYIKALEYNQEGNFVPIADKATVKRVINFQKIKAKRDVSNVEGTRRASEKTLSKMSSKYWEKISNNEEKDSTKELQNQLSETDLKLNDVYGKLFKNVVDKVKRFGGVKQDDSIIKIISTLEEKNILKENTSVMYEHSTHVLPEDYNGLGYLNLISMIFEIEVILNDFKKTQQKNDLPSDINLLFIEEPEAHTHPQMQYVFIKNIKKLLKEECSGKNGEPAINFQTIISTHSAHITAESDFNDIKYFYRDTPMSVLAKNIKSLEEEYEKDGQRKSFDFLKQYLTLNRSELFFADKAILIEGDTERILMPAIMKKIDLETANDESLPLLSQNISIIEVGNYSQVFERFLNFLGIKALIVTDLDPINGTNETKCRVVEGDGTSNSSLKFFFNGKTFEELKKLPFDEKSFSKNGTAAWTVDKNGKLCVVYQTEEEKNKYHAASFEDSFISLNLDFINSNNKKKEFRSLKSSVSLDQKDPYEIANDCIKKKTLFAADIIYFSDDKFKNWEIPGYIKEGLIWLRK